MDDLNLPSSEVDRLSSDRQRHPLLTEDIGRQGAHDFRALQVTRFHYNSDAPACVVSATIWFGIATIAALILPFL